ncbi:F-box only protein 31-like [Branchiostoma lanceolatum]|uniref:F-box only protein 31-like n=1 Tax=Branchiostoma lanceolatum TaxID=7740 RepID=UPI0034524FBF
MGSLVSFPPELLSHILSFLPGKELATAAKVCKAFHEASKVDFVWQRCMAREFGVSCASSLSPSPREIYTKLLYKYGFLLGTWQIEIKPYGGLVHVMFQNNRLLGLQYGAPHDPHVDWPMMKKELFHVMLDDEGNTTINCLQGPQGPHKGQIPLINASSARFMSKCCCPDLHRHPQGREQEFLEWCRKEMGVSEEDTMFQHMQELLFMKFMIINQYQHCYVYKRLTIPSHLPDQLIAPGLFKGTYGSHGLEIVLLTYDRHYIHCKKITGDPNVPASEHSVLVDTKKPLILDEEQQVDPAELARVTEQAEKEEEEMNGNSAGANQSQEGVASGSDHGVSPQHIPQSQPFAIPEGFRERGINYPKTCKMRYCGTGLIAGHGFTSPSRTPGHFVIFDNENFGFLWLELRSLSVYSRVMENLD